MSNMGRSLIVGTLLLFALSPRAQAYDFERAGMYVGLSGSIAKDMAAKKDVKSVLPGTKVRVRNSVGIKGRVGYRFHRHFATEVQAEYLFGFDLKVDGVKPVTYEILAATANAKLFLAAKDIQPYALVGLGYLYANANDNSGLDVSLDVHGPAFRSGGGLDFYFSDNTLVSLEATYVLPFEKVEDLDYLTIGLGFQYRF